MKVDARTQQMAGRYGVPAKRKSLLHRERLTSALHQGIGNGLLLVQAPAGFGKTTLLADVAAELAVDYNVRWLALDASSASPEVFAEQLSSMLNGEFESAGPATAARTEDLKAYMSLAVDRACTGSQLPLLVVLDNAHELKGAEDSLDLLRFFLGILPEGSEIILSSRQALNLRHLDRKIVVGDCLLLGADTLAFTTEEVGELLVRAPGPTTAHEIIAATGGWPVGVMAIIAGTVAPGGRKRRPAGAAWQRYLTTEVWKTIPQRLQRLLLPLSLPPVLPEDLAETLVGRAAWRELSGWLEQRDFLIETLPEGTIRLNELFRQYLIANYEQQDFDGFERTVGYVVGYLEESGRVADAIELARATRSKEALAGLVERHGQRLIHQGAFALLSRAFEGFQSSEPGTRAMSQAIRARVLAHVGNPHEAMKIASEVYDDAGASEQARMHATLAKVRALRTLGQVEQMMRLFTELRTIDDCDDPSVVGELSYHEADIELVVTRNFGRAERLLQKSISHYEAAGTPMLELLARSTIGQLYVMQGRGPEAVNELVKAAQGWRDVRGTANLGWVLNNLGMAHTLVGDFESAIPVLEEALREGELCKNVRNQAYAIGSLADVELSLGHFAKAKARYEEAIRLCATSVLDESLAAMCIAGLAAAETGLGDLTEADFLSRRALLIAGAMQNPFELGYCSLVQAMVDSASGDHIPAIAGAIEATKLFERIEARSNLQLALYRLAQCYFKANRRSEAGATLERLEAELTENWMVASLLPGLRDNPMFAQWSAGKVANPAFKEFVARTLAPQEAEDDDGAPLLPRLPRVVARSLGQLQVSVGGHVVSDDEWTSLRATEMFFLFLARRQGVRKEEAVEFLYPGLSSDKCNSAFHSNLYRVRRALFPESIVRQGGTYLLNAEAEFEWDVDQFEAALARAAGLPPGSAERAEAYCQALENYKGPFAEAFYSEWAEAVRNRVDQHAVEVLATLAGYYAGRGDFERAAECMEQVLGRDRYNEEAAYSLATFHVEAGRPMVALKVIDDYQRAYEDDLGARVPDRFLKLRSRVAAGKLA